MDELGSLRVGPALLADATQTGHLFGTTAVISDTIAVAGHATLAGLDIPAEPATHHAAVVARLLFAGCSVVGITHCSELGLLDAEPQGERPEAHRSASEQDDGNDAASTHAPTAHAVSDRLAGIGVAPQTGHAPTAHAVSDRLAGIGVATDTDGAVRVAAAQRGLVGFRPTHDALDNRGTVPVAPAFDTIGWLTPDGSLAHQVGTALLGLDDTPLPRRLLVAWDLIELVEERAVRGQLEMSARLLSQRVGVPLRRVRFAEADELERWAGAYALLRSHELWQVHAQLASEARLGTNLRRLIEAGAGISDEALAEARRSRTELIRRVSEVLDTDAVLILPTNPSAHRTPSLTGEARLWGGPPPELVCRALAPLAGAPEASLPLAPGRLPCGLSVLAPAGRDDLVLELARSALPGQPRSHPLPPPGPVLELRDLPLRLGHRTRRLSDGPGFAEPDRVSLRTPR